MLHILAQIEAVQAVYTMTAVNACLALLRRSYFHSLIHNRHIAARQIRSSSCPVKNRRLLIRL